MPEIITLLDDDLETTRKLACLLIDKMIEKSGEKLSLDNFYNKIYVELIKRLDDVSDTVRVTSLNIWSKLFSVILDKQKNDEYDASGCYSAHWEYIYKSLILHMDDPDENFRKAVFEVLSQGKEISRRILLEELGKAKDKHKFTGLCEDLEKMLIV